MDKEILHKLRKGRESYEAREFGKAEAYLAKVIEAGGRFADAMNMMGVIYHGKGQLTIAQDYFNKALSINPNYIEAALNLAVTYNDLGQYPKARNLYEHITKLKKDLPDKTDPFAKGKLANMHADLAEAYAEVGDLTNAIDQYGQALRLCPDFIDIRTKLGQILRDAGRLDAACEEFEKVKVIKPSYLPARFSLGITYLALGDRESAKQEWTAVLEADPENLTAEMYIKMVDQMIAQDEAAEAGMRLEIDPPSEGEEPVTEEELSFHFDGKSSQMTSIEKTFPDSEESSRSSQKPR
jgi:tetratricopeptide (TPR) repeat protein